MVSNSTAPVTTINAIAQPAIATVLPPARVNSAARTPSVSAGRPVRESAVTARSAPAGVVHVVRGPAARRGPAESDDHDDERDEEHQGGGSEQAERNDDARVGDDGRHAPQRPDRRHGDGHRHRADDSRRHRHERRDDGEARAQPPGRAQREEAPAQRLVAVSIRTKARANTTTVARAATPPNASSVTTVGRIVRCTARSVSVRFWPT